ncbi:uncharacterized protein LAJ45_09927 [Morchella importuna]|uniref:uncharacterized protein n=1 Tax=Morchella importuna TaxID=1174673 RepID=UPI001E8EA5BD|nr:uncharacterized protein LAJ45_09927 [Morchella importuna]KAH8146005.1 hypothetical protein LAJ45_09927 [Morchella importuna]
MYPLELRLGMSRIANDSKDGGGGRVTIIDIVLAKAHAWEGSFLATLLQLTCVVRTPPIGETICQGRSSPRFCSKTGKKTVFVLFLRTSDEPCSGNPQEGSTTCMHTAALLDIVKYRFSLVRAPLLQRSMKFYNQSPAPLDLNLLQLEMQNEDNRHMIAPPTLFLAAVRSKDHHLKLYFFFNHPRSTTAKSMIITCDRKRMTTLLNEL